MSASMDESALITPRHAQDTVFLASSSVATIDQSRFIPAFTRSDATVPSVRLFLNGCKVSNSP